MHVIDEIHQLGEIVLVAYMNYSPKRGVWLLATYVNGDIDQYVSNLQGTKQPINIGYIVDIFLMRMLIYSRFDHFMLNSA
jgi:hypothetical protein